MDERLKAFEEKMGKSLSNLEEEFSTIRAGRANPHVLDKLRVDYYGTPSPIQSVANVSVPEPRMIQIQPWEASMVKEIEKAIITSDLGINPTNDGKLIRLVFPELTEEKVVKPMVSSMDHKRVGDNDTGLNTGGMGTVAPNPCYTADIAAVCMETIFLPTINAMNAEGRTFKGCLYFGLMLTKNGPKVIEYNCRFGDPETQVVLPLLKSDLLTVMMACTNGTLAKTPVRFARKHACCVIKASAGYPESYKKGFKLTMSDRAAKATFVAGAKLENGNLVTSGGRVTGTTAVRSTLEDAITAAYRLSAGVKFRNAYCRSDIGQKALQAKK